MHTNATEAALTVGEKRYNLKPCDIRARRHVCLHPTGDRRRDNQRHRVIRQQLVAALNEAAGEGKPNKLREVVDALIARAIDGDVQAIKEIIDRVDGRVPQAIVGDAESGPVVLRVVTGVLRGDRLPGLAETG